MIENILFDKGPISFAYYAKVSLSKASPCIQITDSLTKITDLDLIAVKSTVNPLILNRNQ
jgi:hypothetical protein